MCKSYIQHIIKQLIINQIRVCIPLGYKHPLATHYSDQISRKKEFRFLLSFFLKRQYCDLSVYTNPYLASN